MVKVSKGRMSFDVAWRQVRVQRHPDEAGYRRQGHEGPAPHGRE